MALGFGYVYGLAKKTFLLLFKRIDSAGNTRITSTGDTRVSRVRR